MVSINIRNGNPGPQSMQLPGGSLMHRSGQGLVCCGLS